MLGTTLPTPLYPLYERRFAFAPLTITVIFATYAFFVAAGLLLCGPQSDRVGRRPVLLAGLALSALNALAFLFANNLALILAGRALSGLSAGIFTGSATAMLIEIVPERRRRARLLCSRRGHGARCLLHAYRAEARSVNRRLLRSRFERRKPSIDGLHGRPDVVHARFVNLEASVHVIEPIIDCVETA